MTVHMYLRVVSNPFRVDIGQSCPYPGFAPRADLFDPSGVVSEILLLRLSMTAPFRSLSGAGGTTSQMAATIDTGDAESVE